MYLDDNIAWLNAWVLIGLSVENVLFAIGGALVDLDLDDLLFLDDLLAVACLTLVFLTDYLTLTLAVIAGARALRVHAGPQLLHHCAHTLALAGAAVLHCTGLSTLAVALGADAVTAD